MENIKKFDRIGSDEHLDILEKAIEKAIEILDKKKESIDSYGLSISEATASKAHEIPQSVKALIVPRMRKVKLRSLHEFNTEREYEKLEDTFPAALGGGALAALYRPKPKLLSVTHEITQNYSWPKSYSQISIESDGYLPNCIVFIYIVPLMTSISLFTGFIVDYGEGANIEEQDRVIDGPVILRAEEPDLNEAISRELSEIIERFNESFYSIVSERVEYLEWENHQLE